MSKHQITDETLYCESCGISFLWTNGEQSKASGAPLMCPGCRSIRPQASRERGLVKWYNRRKRFGFIVRREQPEIFVHGSALSGAGTLMPGDLVEFEVTESDKGLNAAMVTLLQSAAAAGTTQKK